MGNSRTIRGVTSRGLAALALLAALVAVSAGPAHADTVIDGPIDLGTAETFGVLGSSTVTNTGSSRISGDVGVSPGTEITGFPPGEVLAGTTYAGESVAAGARADLTTAFGVASSLTPTTTGLGDLAGLTLVPGVYSGEELSLSGTLTLAGAADSVWVFQAASTLITGSGSTVVVTGGASSCNVFWRVGSSATLGTSSTLVGTVLADASISAATDAEIHGRLLARTGAVTLDSNTITRPASCEPGQVGESPVFTSGPTPDATEGTAYSSTVVATGTPEPTYTVTDGALPPGLELDSDTGAITGTPTAPGTSTFEITASNDVSPDAVETYTITVAEAPEGPAGPGTPSGPSDDDVTGSRDGSRLPATGADPAAPTTVAAIALGLGLALVTASVLARRRRS